MSKIDNFIRESDKLIKHLENFKTDNILVFNTMQVIIKRYKRDSDIYLNYYVRRFNK